MTLNTINNTKLSEFNRIKSKSKPEITNNYNGDENEDDDDDNFIVYQVHLEENQHHHLKFEQQLPGKKNNTNNIIHVTKDQNQNQMMVQKSKRNFFDRRKSTSTNNILNHGSISSTSSSTKANKNSKTHRNKSSQQTRHQIEIEFDLDPLPERDEKFWYSTNDVSFIEPSSSSSTNPTIVQHQLVNLPHSTKHIKSSKSSSSILRRNGSQVSTLKKLKKVVRKDEEELRFEHHLEKALGEYVSNDEGEDEEEATIENGSTTKNNDVNYSHFKAGLNYGRKSFDKFSVLKDDEEDIDNNYYNDSYNNVGHCSTTTSDSLNFKTVKLPMSKTNIPSVFNVSLNGQNEKKLVYRNRKVVECGNKNKNNVNNVDYDNNDDDDESCNNSSNRNTNNRFYESNLKTESKANKGNDSSSSILNIHEYCGSCSYSSSRSLTNANSKKLKMNDNNDNDKHVENNNNNNFKFKPQNGTTNIMRNPLVVTFNFHKLHPPPPDSSDDDDDVPSPTSSTVSSVTALSKDNSISHNKHTNSSGNKSVLKASSSKSKSVSLPEKLWNELFHRSRNTSSTESKRKAQDNNSNSNKTKPEKAKKQQQGRRRFFNKNKIPSTLVSKSNEAEDYDDDEKFDSMMDNVDNNHFTPSQEALGLDKQQQQRDDDDEEQQQQQKQRVINNSQKMKSFNDISSSSGSTSTNTNATGVGIERLLNKIENVTKIQEQEQEGSSIMNYINTEQEEVEQCEMKETTDGINIIGEILTINKNKNMKNEKKAKKDKKYKNKTKSNKIDKKNKITIETQTQTETTNFSRSNNDDNEDDMIIIDDDNINNSKPNFELENEKAVAGSSSTSGSKNKHDKKVKANTISSTRDSKWKSFIGKIKSSSKNERRPTSSIYGESQSTESMASSQPNQNLTLNIFTDEELRQDQGEEEENESLKKSHSFESVKKFIRKSTRKKNRINNSATNSMVILKDPTTSSSTSMISKIIKVDKLKLKEKTKNVDGHECHDRDHGDDADDDDYDIETKSNPTLNLSLGSKSTTNTPPATQEQKQEASSLLFPSTSSSSSISTPTVPIRKTSPSSSPATNFFRSFRLKKNKVGGTSHQNVEKLLLEEENQILASSVSTKNKIQKVVVAAPSTSFYISSSTSTSSNNNNNNASSAGHSSNSNQEKVFEQKDQKNDEKEKESSNKKEKNHQSMTIISNNTSNFDRRGGGSGRDGFVRKVNSRLFSSFYTSRKSRIVNNKDNNENSSTTLAMDNGCSESTLASFSTHDLEDVTLDLASGQLQNTSDGSVIGRANVIVEQSLIIPPPIINNSKNESKKLKKNETPRLSFYIKSNKRKSVKPHHQDSSSSLTNPCTTTATASSSGSTSLLSHHKTLKNFSSSTADSNPLEVETHLSSTDLYSAENSRKNWASADNYPKPSTDSSNNPSTTEPIFTTNKRSSSKKKHDSKKSSSTPEPKLQASELEGNEDEEGLNDSASNSTSASPTKSSSFINKVKQKSKKIRKFSLKRGESTSGNNEYASSASPSSSSLHHNFGDGSHSGFFENDNPLFNDNGDDEVRYSGQGSKPIDIVRLNMNESHISEEEGLSSLPNSINGSGGCGRTSQLGSLSETDEYTGPFVGKAIALVDCTPSPYDKYALRYKKGDVIQIISKNPTGLWTGKVNGTVGRFKFINIEILPAVSDEDEVDSLSSHDDPNVDNNYSNYSSNRRRTRRTTPMTPWEIEQRQTVANVINGIRKENAALLTNSHSSNSLVDNESSSSTQLQHHQQEQLKSSSSNINNADSNETTSGITRRKPSSSIRQGRPKSVGDLLRRINLEEHISVFILHGFESLDLFKELEEEDLNRLAIMNPSDRGKLLTAVELLREFDTEDEIPPIIIPTYSSSSILTNNEDEENVGSSNNMLGQSKNNVSEYDVNYHRNNNIITPPPNFTKTCGKIVRDSGVFVKCDDDDNGLKEHDNDDEHEDYDYDVTTKGQRDNSITNAEVEEIILSPSNLPIELTSQKLGLKSNSRIGIKKSDGSLAGSKGTGSNKTHEVNNQDVNVKPSSSSSISQRFLNAKSFFETAGPSSPTHKNPPTSPSDVAAAAAAGFSKSTTGLDGNLIPTTNPSKSPKGGDKVNPRFLYCEKSSDSGISVGANSPTRIDL